MRSLIHALCLCLLCQAGLLQAGEVSEYFADIAPDFQSLDYQRVYAGAQLKRSEPWRVAGQHGADVVGYSFALPKITKQQTLVVQASLKDKLVFFSFVYILDESYQIISTFSASEVERVLAPPAPAKPGFSVPISVNQNARFLVILMPSFLEGQEMKSEFLQKDADFFLPGPTPIYIPGQYRRKTEEAVFDAGSLVTLTLPYTNENEPNYRANGLWFELGTEFSDTKIRGKFTDEKFDLGGGAFFSMAFQRGLGAGWLRNTSWFIKGGFRGNFGKEEGHQVSFPVQLALQHQFWKLRVAYGYQVDLGYSMDFGEQRESFRSNLAPVIQLDLIMSDRGSLGLTSRVAEYESGDGTIYKTNVTGIRLQINY